MWQAEVGLFLVLLEIKAVAAAEDLPIDVPQIVPRYVLSVLGELN